MTGQRVNEDTPQGYTSATFDVVVIGTSAGGFQALTIILGSLPDPFPLPIVFVLHLSPTHESFLPEVLSRATGRTIQWATDGVPLTPGTIYAAPPDHHVVIDRGWIKLTSTPAVRFSRPAIDRLFLSAGEAFGPGVLAVLLTGNGSDGSAGATAVRRAGGFVIAQNEESSEFFSMPGQAIRSGAATCVLPLNDIAGALTRLVREGRGALPDILAKLPRADSPGKRRASFGW